MKKLFFIIIAALISINAYAVDSSAAMYVGNGAAWEVSAKAFKYADVNAGIQMDDNRNGVYATVGFPFKMGNGTAEIAAGGEYAHNIYVDQHLYYATDHTGHKYLASTASISEDSYGSAPIVIVSYAYPLVSNAFGVGRYSHSYYGSHYTEMFALGLLFKF